MMVPVQWLLFAAVMLAASLQSGQGSEHSLLKNGPDFKEDAEKQAAEKSFAESERTDRDNSVETFQIFDLEKQVKLLLSIDGIVQSRTRDFNDILANSLAQVISAEPTNLAKSGSSGKQELPPPPPIIQFLFPPPPPPPPPPNNLLELLFPLAPPPPPPPPFLFPSRQGGPLLPTLADLPPTPPQSQVLNSLLPYLPPLPPQTISLLHALLPPPPTPQTTPPPPSHQPPKPKS